MDGREREVGFSLGSNVGDRLANLCAARDAMAATTGIRIVAQSPVYDTEPVGVGEAYRDMTFLNAVVIAATTLETAELARVAQTIETRLGRHRVRDRNAPRTIDIDIVYVEGERLARPELTVPHERWSTRRFVAQPLADVRPQVIVPGETRSVREVLLTLPESPRVSRLVSVW